MIPNTDLKSKIIRLVTETLKKHDPSSELTVSVAKKLKSEFSILNNTDYILELQNIIGKIIKKINDYIDLTILELPVVIFKGERSDLPDIFEKINTQGTTLSKYEIFAFVWNNDMFKIEDNEILDCVEKKYEMMIDKSGISISGYIPGAIQEKKEINLFEYAYAVGKIIRNKCPEMFVKNNPDLRKLIQLVLLF